MHLLPGGTIKVYDEGGKDCVYESENAWGRVGEDGRKFWCNDKSHVCTRVDDPSVGDGGWYIDYKYIPDNPYKWVFQNKKYEGGVQISEE